MEDSPIAEVVANESIVLDVAIVAPNVDNSPNEVEVGHIYVSISLTSYKYEHL